MLRYLRIHPVLVISIAQLFATSLWFSANSAGFDLMREWQMDISDLGLLTNAVQAGFILGTFLIALSGIADRYQASLIFSCSALLGSFFNLCFAWLSQNMIEALFFRLLVGISLAGIYPIGMKLIIKWAPHQAGQALSQLVAMLTLGTALPYALNSISIDLPWQYMISTSSIFAVIAAMFIFYLGDKQDVKEQKKVSKSSLASPFAAFKIPHFKAAALGYFGHMWELYTFWTIVPLLIVKTSIKTSFNMVHSSFLTFIVISIGALGCICGGILSQYMSNRIIALVSLASSGLCCLFFVLGWEIIPTWLLLMILMIWGMTVIADSPQFSALSAQACSIEQLGGALALQNSFGFFLTIISITITTMAFDRFGINALWVMLIGPVLGILGYIKFDRVRA